MAENEKNVAEVKNEAKQDKQKKSKPAKAKNDKKQGKVKNAWKGFKSELGKIVWPTWKQVLKNTGIVVVIVLICSLSIFALDLAFNKGFEALVELAKKIPFGK